MGNRKSNAPRTFSLLCVALASCLPSARAQLPHAQLRAVFPAGAQAGTRVAVQVDGADLDDAKLLFSHPGITASPKTGEQNRFDPEPEPIPGQFLVNVADDVPPGIYEVRAAGYFGISNPRLFAVNHLSEVIAGSDQSRFENALELPIDSVVNARAASEQIHHYRFSVPAGGPVLVECVAAQIDSRMDATLILWDSSGQELARVRDTVGRDPVLALAPEDDTEYVVGAYDFTYGGGNEFVYRLAVHRRPRLWFVFPPVGTTGRTSAFSLYGWNLPGGQPADEMQFESASLERLDKAIRLDGARQVVSLGPPQALHAVGVPYRVNGPTGLSNPLVIQQTELPVVIEGSSNDTPDSAEPIPMGCEYVGRLFPQSDVDWVKFAANSGDVIDIDVLSDRIDATADPVLTVEKMTFNTDGKPQIHPIATIDDARPKGGGGIGRLFDTGSADPSYRLVADEPAFYRVGVRDVYGNPRGDPRRIYRLVVRRSRGDFRLAAFAEPSRAADRNLATLGGAVLRKGGTAVLTVCLDRLGGFDEDVEVTAEDLPDGVTCTTVVLGSHADRAPLVLAADESAPVFGGAIRVVGRPITDVPDRGNGARTALGGTVVWPGNYAQQPVPTRITSTVQLAVVGGDPVPVSIHVGDGNAFETSPGGKLSVPVKVVRRDGFAAELDVAALGLPGGFQANNIKIKKGSGNVELFAAQHSIRPGNYTLVFRTATKAKLFRNAEAIRHSEARKAHFDQLLTRKTTAAQAAASTRDERRAAAQGAAAKLQEQEAALQAAKADVAAADQLKRQRTEAFDAVRTSIAQQPDDASLTETLQTKKQHLEEAIDLMKQAKTRTAALEASVAVALAAHQATEATQAAAEKIAEQTEAVRQRVEDLATQANNRLAEVKKQNGARDYEFEIISRPLQIRVVAAPLDVELTSDHVALRQGRTGRLGIRIHRKHGFTGNVAVESNLPSGIHVTAKNITINQDQQEAQLDFSAEANAAPRTHACVATATLEHNGVSVRKSVPFTLVILPAQPLIDTDTR